MVSWFKGNHSNSIASDGVSAFVVGLPDFKLEFGPTANSFTFIVEVKWMIPNREFIDLISDFFIGFTRVLTVDECPIEAAFNFKLAESP